MREKLGKSMIMLTMSKIITLCISMLTSMLLARFRTLDEYGTYSQMLLVINLASSLFMLGLPNSINYFLVHADTPKDKKHFLSVYYSISTVLCFMIGAVLMCMTPVFVKYFKNDSLYGYVYFMAVYPWAYIIASNIENILLVYQKTKYLLAYKLLNSICLLGTVIFAEVLNFEFNEYLLCFLGVNCCFAILVYWLSSRLCGGINLCIDMKLVKEIFKFSLPLGLATVVGTLNVEIDKLLIGWLMDTEQLAIYTNASKELPITVIATSITAVLMPRIVRLVKEGKDIPAIKLWNVATELSFIIVSIIVFGIFTYAREVMVILYSEKYLPGINVFQIYTLVLLLRITYFGMILNAKGHTKQIMKSSIISLLLNTVLNPLCFYLFGMVGPALATFISMLVVMILQLIWTSKVSKVALIKVFPWKNCGIILGINALFAIFFNYFKEEFFLDKYISNIGESVVLGIIWFVIYLFIMKRRIKSLWTELNTAGEDT